jgi:large subunit ribosomal protein L25
MKIVPLKVEKRESVGKGAARRIRRAGKIPAILYGDDGESMAISVDTKDFMALLHSEAGSHVILRLKIEGLKESPTVIIKDIQRHPIKDSFLHIDFRKIGLDEKITATVPVMTEGESPGVKQGGILQRHLWEVEIEALPKDIPDHITVDISSLEMGESIHVSDIPKPGGVEFVTNGEEVVLSILHPAIERVAPTPEELEKEEVAEAPVEEKETEETAEEDTTPKS